MPTKGALAQARARLGSEPLRALFEQVAAPLATSATAGAWYRELRLVSIDGTNIATVTFSFAIVASTASASNCRTVTEMQPLIIPHSAQPVPPL